MHYFKKILITAGILICAVQNGFAFTVQKVQFNGLQRISRATALSYLPVVIGENLTSRETAGVIETLYRAGFFTNITLEREGNTLIVNVQERPTIADVHVTGNDEIPKDKLDEALKKLGLQQGQVFQHDILQEVKQALVNQYYSGGYYNAKVTTDVATEVRNRVTVNVNVSEGRIAKVMGIRVVGNKAFDESTLVDQFTLSTPGFMTFFNGHDKYSEEGLEKSIEALKDYYLNRGYISMQVNSKQVTITPDRKHVYIVVDITEGKQYHFGTYTITGTLPVAASVLDNYVQVKKGDLFSRQTVLNTNKAISARLEDDGYAYAKVEAAPSVNDKTQIVNLTFNVIPGNRYYVRRIKIDGNHDTTNLALRNYMLQMQDSQYSKSTIEESIRNFRQLPYLKEKELSYGLEPVPGSNNQVDLAMKVKEALSAQFQFNIGYSQAEKFMLSTSVTQQNFMGTGKTVGVTLQGSSYSKTYSLNYTNPFFTPDGVSHSMSTYIQKVNAGAVSIANFSTSSYGFNDSYGLPLSNYDSFNLGYGLKNTHLLIGSSPSTEMSSFSDEHGELFHQLLLTAGWNHNTFDRYKLPTDGSEQGLNLLVSTPLEQKYKLEYYTLTYVNRWYLPLNKAHTWLFTTLVNLGYGNGYGSFNQLPFFENFYAGGLATQGQVRGYDANTLGPRDSDGNTLGGNELISGGMGIVIPNPGQNYGVRTTWFVDAGNVYNTHQGAVNLNKLRYSTGIQVLWWTPLGVPLVFSLSKPIHNQPGDQTDPFQFSLGGSL